MTTEAEVASARDELFAVDADLCIRCGASSGIAPGLVRLGRSSAVVVRQPASVEELALLREVAALCPVGAIAATSAGGE